MIIFFCVSGNLHNWFSYCPKIQGCIDDGKPCLKILVPNPKYENILIIELDIIYSFAVLSKGKYGK